MAQTRFRWGLWGSILGVVVVAVAAFAFTRGTGVTYDNPTSPRPFAGTAEAKVVVQEYSDFQCPACGSAYPYVKSLVQQYANNIRFEFKHYPLTKIHANAYNAALASECANDQGKFWEYHDKLFENQTQLSVGSLKQYAADLSLDTTKFNACVDTRAEKPIVDADMKTGDGLKVPGTPTFFVNGTMVATGDLETAIKAAIGGAVQGPVR